MKKEDIKQKSKIELKRLLLEHKERIRSLKFNLTSGKVKNVREIRKLRKDIARILTKLNTIDNKEIKEQQITNNKK